MYSNKEKYPDWEDVTLNKKIQQMYNLNLATWNIRIRMMLNKLNLNRPERRSAIKFKELQKYNIDIAALSEVRFAKSGNIKEEMGYTFYWNGKTSTDRNESGVAFVIRNGLLSSISMNPKLISDRLIMLRFTLVNSRYYTLIAVYSLTITSSPEKINRFYNQLNQIV